MSQIANFLVRAPKLKKNIKNPKSPATARSGYNFRFRGPVRALPCPTSVSDAALPSTTSRLVDPSQPARASRPALGGQPAS